MTPLAFLAVALAAVALQPETDAPQVPPASEALVDRFIAVIPDAHQVENAQWDIDAEQLTRLTELNPERSGDIEAVSQAYRDCTSPIARAVTMRLLRDAARGLGEEKLERLVAFYQSTDFTTFKAISERGEAGAEVSDADMAEVLRITSDYPVMDFVESTSRAQAALFQDEALVGTILRCEEEMRSALASRDLRDE